MGNIFRCCTTAPEPTGRRNVQPASASLGQAQKEPPKHIDSKLSAEEQTVPVSARTGAETGRGPNVGISLSLLVPEGRGEVHKRYRTDKVLGKGTHGEVRRVVEVATSRIFAMKVIPKGDNPEASVNEIEMLKKLDHPNILRLYEVSQDNDNYYLITEYCSGGELFDRIAEVKHFTEGSAASIMRQLLSAVAYCHSRKIVHRLRSNNKSI